MVDNSLPIARVARELGVNDTTLGFWVKAYRKKSAGQPLPAGMPDGERVRELERRNRELEMESVPQKSRGVLREGAPVSEKYAFIDAECATRAGDEACAPTITQMCEWMAVSKSGCYDWRSRPQSASAERRELLKIKIQALFEANNEEYGYRRIHAALVRGGEQADDETVRRLMRELGLEPCQPRPWRHSLTEQDGQAGPIPDLVSRDFTAEKPGQKMVGDITYIPTWQGWLYLALVIGLRDAENSRLGDG